MKFIFLRWQSTKSLAYNNNQFFRLNYLLHWQNQKRQLMLQAVVISAWSFSSVQPLRLLTLLCVTVRTFLFLQQQNNFTKICRMSLLKYIWMTRLATVLVREIMNKTTSTSTGTIDAFSSPIRSHPRSSYLSKNSSDWSPSPRPSPRTAL